MQCQSGFPFAFVHAMYRPNFVITRAPKFRHHTRVRIFAPPGPLLPGRLFVLPRNKNTLLPQSGVDLEKLSAHDLCICLSNAASVQTEGTGAQNRPLTNSDATSAIYSNFIALSSTFRRLALQANANDPTRWTS